MSSQRFPWVSSGPMCLHVLVSGPLWGCRTKPPPWTRAAWGCVLGSPNSPVEGRKHRTPENGVGRGPSKDRARMGHSGQGHSQEVPGHLCWALGPTRPRERTRLTQAFGVLTWPLGSRPFPHAQMRLWPLAREAWLSAGAAGPSESQASHCS